MKRWTAIALICLSTAAAAQTPATPASSPAKKELVAKIITLQQSAIELLARTLAQQPAMIMMQRAGNVLQTRVPADKRQAVAKEIEGDLKRYMDETVPLLRDRAVALAPATVGPILEEKFSEDELRQLVAIIESPVNRKYLALGAEMQKGLVDKLVADSKAVVDPKIRTLEQTVAGRLGIKPEGPPSSTAPAAPARPASK